MTQKESTPTCSASPQAGNKSSATKELREIITTSLYHKKLALEANFNKELTFAISRDHLICVFITLITILTAVLFVSSPSDLFPIWYIMGVIIMFLSRIIDYSQKRQYFFLIDFCYTAGVQILFFLICRPHSIHLATRTFCFGTGILAWSTVLLSNGLAVNRLDEFCSLWIHTVPSLLAYTLRWTNEDSVIYYKTAPFSFNVEHVLQYGIACYVPYLVWVAGYYFIINKAFKHLTIDGDYLTLVKFMIQKLPAATKLLDMFGPKYRGEVFMLAHAFHFTVTTAISYACFFCQPLHICCLTTCISFAIVNGAKSLISDIARPYKMSLERINSLLSTLG